MPVVESRDDAGAEAAVIRLYELFFCRRPRPEELAHFVGHIQRGEPFDAIIDRFATSPEFTPRQAALFVPPGHFYSPVVDPASVVERIRTVRTTAPERLPDIDMDPARLEGVWRGLLPYLETTPFREAAHAGARYHYRNSAFGFGDAAILRAMILAAEPRRIIEVGSGYSSACMLDTALGESPRPAQLTCIEPYPELLRSLLRPGDEKHLSILPLPIQQVPLETFDVLEDSDILFIDSTHVSKTGSDVNHELFEILPRLKPGVIVHFHDIFYPFEYPHSWVVEENRSWNEIYALRAFLAYNRRFEILFFNDYFLLKQRALIEATFPSFLINTGGSLWLRVR
ncbi:hypothetical protein STHU_30340 [Allostella humosa]|nr:hypothetical protein STHU_30340 [Stella humosa]